MIKFLFLTIPRKFCFKPQEQCTYEQLKAPLIFKEDVYGVTNWTMKHPLAIYSADLKYKHVFKHNEVKVEPLTMPSLEEKWRYFVITKKDGGKYYYCTSQIIYVLMSIMKEKGFLKGCQSGNQSQFFSAYTQGNGVSSQEFYLPKCIVLVSELPYFKLQVNLLKIHKELKKQDPAISYCVEQDLYQLYLEYLEAGRQKQWQSLNIAQYKPKRKTYCPLQLSFSYYVECCNNHDAGECIYIEKASNRQVLHLYKLNPSTLYQIGYFFHLPLSALSLRKIISALLTEKQIIFSSSNPNLTVMVIQTLMQMILPLKWCYMYAPNLPVQLIQAVQQSFMPFIAGVSKQYLPLISKSNKIFVYIDTDEVQVNLDNQEEELYLLSKNFQKFLTCKANSNKQYLEWEKQLRINSILMITTIFKKDMPIDPENGGKKYYSEEQKVSEQKFYEQFLSKSMMYRKLIEDVHEKVYSQFYKLTKMNFNDRKTTLQNKFNSIHSQTIYPHKCDNKKQWIKYYERCMRQKRKTRLNRHSLSMVEHNLVGIGKSNLNSQPFYASNVSLSTIGSNKKIESTNLISHRNLNITHQNATMNSPNQNMRTNYTEDRNQLYQSTVSSYTINSQTSGLKFNMQTGGINNSSSQDVLQTNRNTSFNKKNQKPFLKHTGFDLASPNINSTVNNHNLTHRNVFMPNNNVNQESAIHQSNIFDNTYSTSQLLDMNKQQSVFNLHQGSTVQGYPVQNSILNQNQPRTQVNNYSANKTNVHSSMIFNQNPFQTTPPSQINPLNHSMVTGYFYSQNNHGQNHSLLQNYANTSSYKNLNNPQHHFN